MVREIKRWIEPVEIPISQIENIHIPDEYQDFKFLKLYEEILTGQTEFAYTRIPRSQIQSGFKRLRPDKTIEHIEYPPIDSLTVEIIKNWIRKGHRPTIYLYHETEIDNADFICSDDLNTLKAYSDFGIENIPAVIMNPKSQTLSHTALLFRGMSTLPQEDTAEFFENILLPEKEPAKTPSILGESIDNIEDNSIKLIEKLESNINECLLKIQKFHVEENNAIHWHHTLASTLQRTSRILLAIRKLVELGLYDQALIILRSLYELSTGLYLDWLMPERMGIILQWATYIKGSEWKKELNELKTERLTNGWSEDMAEARRKSHARLYSLAKKISERAKITPLRSFHDELYGGLSSYAHQDFYTVAQFAHAIDNFENSNPLQYEDAKRHLKIIVRFADLASALICYCIKSDIGTIS